VVGRRSGEVSSRRAEILNVASELFATKGFAGTTVRDIADSVGILSGSLYHHFNAKEDMVEEIFKAYFDELTARWDVVLAEPWDSSTKVEAMLRQAFENVDRHTAAARLFTHEWMDLRHLGNFAAQWDQIERMWLALIRAGIKEGTLRSDIDPALLFSVAMDLVRGMSGWYHRGGRYSIQTLADAYIGVLMSGIVAQADDAPAKRPRVSSKAPAKRPKPAIQAASKRPKAAATVSAKRSTR
jgi:TetR/AcrR family transcriptional regulator, cholesterol catabolism regulator